MTTFNLTNKAQGWTMTGFGAVLMLAACLPWVSIAGIFSVNGLAGDGKITLTAGLILASIGTLHALKPEAVGPKTVSIIGGVLGLVALGVTVFDFIGLQSMIAEEDSIFMDAASPGIGLILTGILGGAALALGVLGFLKARVALPEPVTA